MRTIWIPRRLTLSDILDVAYGRARVMISAVGIERMMASRRCIERLVEERRVVYGVNTGLGALASKILTPEDAMSLQERILLSHAVGWGPIAEPEVVRAAMFIRANMLARGYSGVRPEIVVLMCALLNDCLLYTSPSPRDRG